MRGKASNRGLSLSKREFAKFNINALGLGDMGNESEATDAIAAVFDLEGFTNFCKQIEPQLSVPSYLRLFLEWIMENLGSSVIKDTEGDKVNLWCPLPFSVKYLGDGLLVLWDCSYLHSNMRLNVVAACNRICKSYRDKFLAKVKLKYVEPPPSLRCGVARGTVLSIGDGRDYVGSCINMAARLQKLPGVSLCFNTRGLDIEGVKGYSEMFEIREVSIRGIGDHELIGVRKSDLALLGEEDGKIFRKLGS